MHDTHSREVPTCKGKTTLLVGRVHLPLSVSHTYPRQNEKVKEAAATTWMLLHCFTCEMAHGALLTTTAAGGEVLVLARRWPLLPSSSFPAGSVTPSMGTANDGCTFSFPSCMVAE
jgi:hypothetical protein